MSYFSRKKKHNPSNSAPANPLASQSQATQQPIYPWSAHTLPLRHTPPLRQSPSPFLREAHALSPTATAAGELLLFGGYLHSSNSASNDLYKFSTRNFSTTLLKTRGQAPSPRYGHGAALTSTDLLIWGGVTNFSDHHDNDSSLYLLNLVSREWTSVVVNGPRPRGRCYHTVTLVGSELFVFGGKIAERYLNDIWAFDLNCLESNPICMFYEPTPGNEKPLPRYGHVSVTTDDRIIIFGGYGGPHVDLNDTWSFNISTRKWTELQCTGSIPSPRSGHAAVLVDNVMYVFGGHTINGTYLGDLTALNLSTRRWTAFQHIGPSPCGRWGHAMASDGRRVFVLGGELLPGAQVDEANLIHVLDMKLLDHVRIADLERQLSETPAAKTEWDRHIARLTDQLAQKCALLEQAEANAAEAGLELRRLQAKLTRTRDEHFRAVEQAQSAPQKATSRAADADGRSRLACEQIGEYEKKLSEVRAELEEKTSELEAVRLQLTDQLAQKSALLEQAEANAAETKKHAGLELHELQAKLNELTLSRDDHLRTIEQAQSALQQATSRAADANERSQVACEQIREYEAELAEVRAELEEKKSELEAVRLQLTGTDAKYGGTKSSAKAEKWGAQNTAGPVNTDEDRVTPGIMERMRAIEAKIASMQWSEKNFEMMECSNEG